MDLNFLPPLLAGAALTIASGWVQSKFRRLDSVKDQRTNVGHEAARDFLTDLIDIRSTTLDNQGLPLRNDAYKFEPQQLRTASSHALLLTDRRLRETAEFSMRTINSTGPARKKLEYPTAEGQRSVIAHLITATAAYLRHDPLPEKELAFVDDFNETVHRAWLEVIGESE